MKLRKCSNDNFRLQGNRERGFEAIACAALGGVNRIMKKFDKAFHTQELTHESWGGARGY